MFKKAVDAHQRSICDPSQPSQPGTSVPQYDPILRPSAPNALNNANTAVKRTAAGIPKMSHNNPPFKSQRPALGSQQNPVDLDALKLVKPKGQLQEDVFICDDDFDSDVDLSIEDLSAKPTFTYPKLPSSVSKPEVERPTYPSLAKASLHTHASHDSGYASKVSDAASDDAPVPWSSSPIEHRQAAASRPRPQQVSTHESAPPQRPPKRRTLPWLQANTAEEDARRHDQAIRSHDTHTTQTPKSKPSQNSAYPWDTTASAIKEQQKQLKKFTASKKTDEATDGESQTASATSSVATTTSRAKAEKIHRVVLSNEQQHILNLVKDRSESVFFTGSAGTGKSVLLREIITVLKRKYSREADRVAVTASTGLAACNIGGVTLHSFAGIGLGKDSAQEMVKKIKRNQKHKHRWLRTKVLIVDEVSMVDGALFDKLEEVARTLRNNGRPFGGIQLVITGDFFQLPPVPDRGGVAKFCFESETWKTVMTHTIGLHQVFRQKDPQFANSLNEMRRGQLTQETITTFRGLSRPLDNGPIMALTELFSTRAEVENANRQRMEKLHGEEQMFLARDGGTLPDEQRTKLLENCMAPREVTLKKGAQVMLIKNIDEMLVNGSLGKVIGFMNESQFDSYNSDKLSGFGAQDLDVDGLDAYEDRKRKFASMVGSTTQAWPLVRFQMSDGTTRDLLCQREAWKVEQPNGEVLASRSQIPLILAWALSIHKAQGQTLERVKVNLTRVFEKGQAYVALSRATSLAGLQVLGFDPKKVLAHPKVVEFYNNLKTIKP